jgi:hypothetical protein
MFPIGCFNGIVMEGKQHLADEDPAPLVNKRNVN